LSFENDKFIIKEDGYNFLNSIKEEIILITIISATDDKKETTPVEVELLSSLTNLEIKENTNHNALILYSTDLKKENLKTKILVIDINSSNKYLLSLLFFTSALFIFCFDENINEKELNKFLLINSLPSTIKVKKESHKDAILNGCAPTLYFYIANSDHNSLSDNWDIELQKKDTDNNINLLKDNILKFFSKREYLLYNQNIGNTMLINKIIEEINPKNIEGKRLDGKSLAFFLQNFCEKHNSTGALNFDKLFENLINNDLNIFKNDALSYFKTEMNKLDQIENEEYLIPKIYQIKIDSIEIFNHIYNLNHVLFNNFQYKYMYNKAKSELEKKFTELENQKLLENLNKSETFCNKLLNDLYEEINRKMLDGKYNVNNTGEYMKDYEKFINEYKKESKGNNKLKCLINFLEIKKPMYFKYLLGYNTLEHDNDTIEGQVISKNEENCKKIEDIRNKLDRKKREIKNLNAEIDRVEEDIKKAKSLDEESGSHPFKHSK
jgi:hypothetical protein